MIIYFDESYDAGPGCEYLILGATFNRSHRAFHRNLRILKHDKNFVDDQGQCKEIKYSKVKTDYLLEIGKGAIDIFIESDSYFRAIVVKESLVDLNMFGKPFEDYNLKRARMYKRFAELLIANNTAEIFDAQLFVDQILHCREDEFVERMKEEFCVPFGKHSKNSKTPTLRDIRQIQSHLEQNHVNQINDILTGCILNQLKPPKCQQKIDLRDYLISELGVGCLTERTWGQLNKWQARRYCEKYCVWYWQPK